MYLKRIEIQGFKSFADKTTIEFTNEVTAIVGPNGSGKSNISDAIRWVLGEQSIKYLRGNKMEDVIFSGTDKRKPLGYSEVNIIFDNKDHLLPIDYNEVSIKRRMFRSGESEYFINNSLCRLKDIRLLIMDTGIGKEGYSIIGQGRIEEILSNKPEERRNIFEEAAGIVKFKTKKEEAERKLKSTEDNLVRIKDLISEVKAQYDKLEKDAEKAMEFTTLFEELKNKEISMNIKDIRQSKNQIEEIDTILNDLKDNTSKLEKRRDILKNTSQEIQAKLNYFDNKVEELRKQKIEIFTQSEKTNSNISLLKEVKNFSNRDLNRLENEKERLEELIQEKNIELSILVIESISARDDLDNSNKKYKNIESEMLGIEEELNKNMNKFNQNQKELKNISEELLVIKNNINNTSYRTNELNNNIIKYKKELALLKEELSTNKLNIESLEMEILNLSNQLQENQELLTRLNLNKKDLINIKEKKNNEIRLYEIEIEGLNSSLKLYNTMEESFDGYYKGVKNLINAVKNNHKLQDGFIGPIVNLITVEDIYEKAIDVSLASNIQNIVVEKESNAKSLIEYLKNNNLGRVTFLPLNTIDGFSLSIDKQIFDKFGIQGIAYNLIKYDPKYENIFKFLLGRTIIIDNIDNAIRMSKSNGYKYKFVTLDGEIINPGGSFTGGSFKHNNISILNRKKYISKYRKSIEKHNNILVKLREDEAKVKNQLELLENEITSILEKIRDNEMDANNLLHKIEVAKSDRNKLRQNYHNTDEEIQILKKEVMSNTVKIDNDKLLLSNYKIEYEALFNTNEKLSNEYNKTLSSKDTISGELTEYKIEINQKENRFLNIEAEQARLRNEKKDLENSFEKASNSIIKLYEEIESSKDKLSVLYTSLEDLENNQKENELTLENSIAERVKLKECLQSEQDELENISSTISRFEKDINNKDLMISKLTLKVDNILDNLKEVYNLDYKEALNYEIEINDKSSTKNRVNQLKRVIRDLGNINISAIEDFKEIKERLDFLSKQYDDLTKSKVDLISIIKDIETEMKKIFLNSFNKIKKNFTEVFSILFNGGRASLTFDDESDILNTGIEIQAQPPGKRLQNINLLSGGEKSLTAVAILFAILQTKPSPFCVLDEIDASLDEANISRYTDYLTKFKENTQFILITHRKTTMEIANILYGVTMENEGVSKLVSVKLRDYLENTAS